MSRSLSLLCIFWLVCVSVSGVSAQCIVPGTVTLTPIDDGCAVLTQNFQWSLPSGKPNSYEFHCSRSETFSHTVLTAQTYTTSHSLALAGGTWHWRVRAINDCGIGPWSAADHFMLYEIPVAHWPGGNTQVCSGAEAAYGWFNPASGPVYPISGYQVQWANNASFVSPIELFTTTNIIYQAIHGSGTWYWRVRAHNQCGTSPWSTTMVFKVVMSPPNGLPVSPANGSFFCHTIDIPLCWEEIADATHYDVASATSLTALASASPISTTSTCHILSSYATGTNYWRVRAVNGCGTGAWSDARYFLSITETPGSNALSHPFPGILASNGSSLTFAWTAAPRAEHYEYQWTPFTNPSFAGAFTTNTASTSMVRILNQSGSWVWRVRPVNACGVGPWAGPRSYTVCNPMSGEMTLEHPPDAYDDCIDGLSSNLFTWYELPGAFLYKFQWSGSSNFAERFSRDTDKTYLWEKLPRDRTSLYWRVIPIGDCGLGTPSPPHRLNLSPIPDPPSLITPVDRALILAGSQVRLTWDPVPWANTYKVLARCISNGNTGSYYIAAMVNTNHHILVPSFCDDDEEVEWTVRALVHEEGFFCEGSGAPWRHYTLVPDAGIFHMTFHPDTHVLEIRWVDNLAEGSDGYRLEQRPLTEGSQWTLVAPTSQWPSLKAVWSNSIPMESGAAIRIQYR